MQHQFVQVQAGAEMVGKRRLQDLESDAGQVFHRGNAVDDDGFMVGQAGQKSRTAVSFS